MITYKEFEIIRTLLKLHDTHIADLASEVYSNVHYYAFKSRDEVSDLIGSLQSKGYVSDGQVTDAALQEIAPLKVENAVILAAGGSLSKTEKR